MQFTRRLHQIMSDQNTQKEITSLLNKMCNKLPKSHIEEVGIFFNLGLIQFLK